MTSLRDNWGFKITKKIVPTFKKDKKTKQTELNEYTIGIDYDYWNRFDKQ